MFVLFNALVKVTFLADVSIASADPIPSAAFSVTTESLPVVWTSCAALLPPSRIPPSSLLTSTAFAELFEVTNRPRVMLPSAVSVMLPLPALITVSSARPSVIVMTPELLLSASAVTVTLPVVLVKSPDAANVTSSSANS